MSHKKKRNIIIGVLCGVLLLMVVGYAAFSSVLNIKGTSNVSSNWNIKITSITSKTLSGNATNVKEPEGVGTLTASFETNLESPGDSIEYTITISNSGDINAKLDKITLSEPDNEYVTFETSGLTEGEPLNAGSTADLIVTVTFKDVEINKMDKSTSKLTVTLDYSQADGSSSETPTPSGPYAAEMLAEKVVTTGDGLYLDIYEPGVATFSSDSNINARYVYKGANPDNYITFNGELWRILAVESDGTLKIMKKDSIGNIEWDTSNSNNWARPATLNTYLNNDYYNTLSNEAQALIQTHTWGIGAVVKDNTDLAAQIASENSTTWTGNIGLISASDAIKSNTNIEQCGNLNLSFDNKAICKTTNYIFPSNNWFWTISPSKNVKYDVLVVGSESWSWTTSYACGSGFTCDTNDADVLPALYLKSDITLEGEGTESNPYTIK